MKKLMVYLPHGYLLRYLRDRTNVNANIGRVLVTLVVLVQLLPVGAAIVGVIAAVVFAAFHIPYLYIILMSAYPAYLIYCYIKDTHWS